MFDPFDFNLCDKKDPSPGNFPYFTIIISIIQIVIFSIYYSKEGSEITEFNL